ncbi:unnamed protein product [Bursaphelenchus okinawaensis]|uniref:Uncharacterized protein n=1 Tax=Bursaphelenchus okinawaensis TaxID=465554 RepID=A0A811LKK9_9BILA|nr:unnamed protein product [Bursaphelenchus okinawaensis]CAG9127544.1 unnamed protein product [Bursaphelenchus okinawaensis]
MPLSYAKLMVCTLLLVCTFYNDVKAQINGYDFTASGSILRPWGGGLGGGGGWGRGRGRWANPFGSFRNAGNPWYRYTNALGIL